MNDGFTALWLGTIGGILYATGWHERGAEPPSLRYLLLFIASLFLLHALELQIGPHIRVSGSAALLIAASLIAASIIRNGGHAALLLIGSAAAGMMWSSMHFLYKNDPVFIIFRPRWDAPIFAGIIAGLLTDKARAQYVTVTLAAAAAAPSELLLTGGSDTAVIGDLAWWDGYAVALAAARLIGTVRTGFRQTAVKIDRLRLRQRGRGS